MSNENLAEIKARAIVKLQEAEQAMYEYACACEIGQERNKAFDMYENVRRAAVAKPANSLMGE